MDRNDFSVKLEYNSERRPLVLPEYGRNVLKMVESLKSIQHKEERTEQAMAVIKVMSLLNPGIKVEDNWEQRLWDHLYLMAGFDLDIDSPYPMPEPDNLYSKPEKIPIKKKYVKASHYGRNIENIIDLIAEAPEGDQKYSMIRQLAIYMRQQYLIWNKDSVADETIFKDIEWLSEGRIKVPEDMNLTKISHHGNFSRPSLNLDFANYKKPNMQNKMYQKRNNKK